MHRLDVLLAVSLCLLVGLYAARGIRELTWIAPAPEGVTGVSTPLRLDGRWILEPVTQPLREPAASRQAVLDYGASRGLTLGPPRAASGARVGPPALIRLRGGRHALLLEQTPDQARLFDPMYGELVLPRSALAESSEGVRLPMKGVGR